MSDNNSISLIKLINSFTSFVFDMGKGATTLKISSNLEKIQNKQISVRLTILQTGTEINLFNFSKEISKPLNWLFPHGPDKFEYLAVKIIMGNESQVIHLINPLESADTITFTKSYPQLDEPRIRKCELENQQIIVEFSRGLNQRESGYVSFKGHSRVITNANLVLPINEDPKLIAEDQRILNFSYNGKLKSYVLTPIPGRLNEYFPIPADKYKIGHFVAARNDNFIRPGEGIGSMPKPQNGEREKPEASDDFIKMKQERDRLVEQNTQLKQKIRDAEKQALKSASDAEKGMRENIIELEKELQTERKERLEEILPIRRELKEKEQTIKDIQNENLKIKSSIEKCELALKNKELEYKQQIEKIETAKDEEITNLINSQRMTTEVYQHEIESLKKKIEELKTLEELQSQFAGINWTELKQQVEQVKAIVGKMKAPDTECLYLGGGEPSGGTDCYYTALYEWYLANSEPEGFTNKIISAFEMRRDILSSIFDAVEDNVEKFIRGTEGQPDGAGIMEIVKAAINEKKEGLLEFFFRIKGVTFTVMNSGPAAEYTLCILKLFRDDIEKRENSNG